MRLSSLGVARSQFKTLSPRFAFATVALLAMMAIGSYLTAADGASAQSDASMRLNVTSGGECDGDRCTVPLGGDFTLAVEIETAPAGGYIGAQSFIDFGRRVTYNPADTSAEIVWPDCETSVAVRGEFGPGAWTHGCLTGVVPPLPVSTHVGLFAAISLTCSRDPSSTIIRLLPLDHPTTLGSGAGFALGDESQVVAEVSDLRIDCGQGSTLEPSSTPPDTVEAPPIATRDANATGGPTPTDGDDPEATVDGTPTAAGGENGNGGDDEDDNGGANTLLIMAIIAVVVVLAASGGGYYFWRQRTAQGGPTGGAQE